MEHSVHCCCSFTSRICLCDPWTTAPRLPCPSLSPRVCLNSCPLSWWCHLTILSSVIHFSSCPQSFLGSGSFPVTQLFASGDPSIEVSASEAVLPMKIQEWFPLGLTGLILLSKRLSRVFSSITIWKHQSSALSLLYDPTLTSVYEYCKNHSFDLMDLSGQSDVSAFLYVVYICHSFSSME